MVVRGLFRVTAFIIATGFGGWSIAASAGVLDDAEKLIKSGNATEALKLLEPLENERAGTARFDLLLGIAYVDSGQPALGVFALERALDVDPKNVQARAELARAYFLLGENDAARQEFEEAKKQQPPAGVQATIDKFLAAIDQRFVADRGGFSGFLQGRGGFDSNVNSATDSSTVPLAGGIPFTLSRNSREQSSGVVGILGSGRYTRPLRSDLNAFIEGDFDVKENTSAQFDTSTLGANAGLQLLKGRDQYRVAVNGQLFWIQDPAVNQEINRRLYGGSVEWRRAVTGNDLLTAFGQVSRINYPGQSVRDVMNYTIGAGWTRGFQGRGRPVVFVSAYGGTENEKNRAFPHFGRKFVGGRLGGQYNIMPKATLYGTFLYQHSNYGAVEPIFGKRRKDNLFDFSLGVNYRVAPKWVITPEARYTKNSSKLDVDDFDRAQVYISARRSFN